MIGRQPSMTVIVENQNFRRKLYKGVQAFPYSPKNLPMKMELMLYGNR